jgi:hypothetical protein
MLIAACIIAAIALITGLGSLLFLAVSNDVLNPDTKKDPSVNFWTLLLVGPASYVQIPGYY